MVEKSNKRNMGLDALRIVSMVLIITLHSIDHSGLLEAADTIGGFSAWYTRFLFMLVQVCVNCYVLISGYFLVESQFRLYKLLVLWMEVVFYTITIRVVFIALGYKTLSIVSIVSCFAPIFTGRYWYVSIYFGLYLLSPFLNILISAMGQRQHMTLNVLLFFLMSAMVSIHPAFQGMNSGAGWGLAWFVTLYLLAAWLKLNYQTRGKPLYYFLGWVGIALVVTMIYKIGGQFQ